MRLFGDKADVRAGGKESMRQSQQQIVGGRDLKNVNKVRNSCFREQSNQREKEDFQHI